MATVVKALVRRGEHVLLVRRSRGDSLSGRLELPGGKADHGECHRAALERELREETGLRLAGEPKLVREHAARSPRGRDLRVLTFACQVQGEVSLSDEHDEARWHHPQAAPPAELTDVARDVLGA